MEVEQFDNVGTQRFSDIGEAFDIGEKHRKLTLRTLELYLPFAIAFIATSLLQIYGIS
jgi:hypothetical protein